ncbi:MAG: histidine phosphatase family protein [Glaciihabitans sp.]|nr:histidine phosphatase family protein [Glaciihabitans sp.]
MRLLLIRHGQTPSNVEGLLDTRIPGPGLTELGFEQAAAVPAQLEGEPIDALFASVQVRTHLTAAPLVADRGLPLQIREGIREISSGDYEMRKDEEAVGAYLDALFAWADGDLEVRLAGGESGVEVMARFDEVVREAHAAGHGTAAIFAHGAVIRLWAGVSAGNLGGAYIRDHPLGNTGIVVLEGSPDTGWQVLSYMGEAIGGPAVDDLQHAGPAGETDEE